MGSDWLLEPLRHGGAVALLSGVLISPIGGIVLRIVAERRAFRLREQYLAFVFGDVALAVSIAAGGHVLRSSANDLLSFAAPTVFGLGFVFGVAQGCHDVVLGRNSRR